ncbi:MAG: LptF/LptG family permease, partial [Cyclobacteriaceae bacterium]|nr:LptF/LptG family permease [Cyclobacteriaceae bacterium]
IRDRKAKDDSLRKEQILLERELNDSLAKSIDDRDSLRLDSSMIKDNPSPELRVSAKSNPQLLDSAFKRKLERKGMADSLPRIPEPITTVDTAGIGEVNKTPLDPNRRLTEQEQQAIDSLMYQRGYMTNAITMALNNSRNLKNTFNVKASQVDGHEREYRRYEIAWYQKYTQALACFVMFLIGAPLGSIIKKGGLGLPVLISIVFFILYYMLTITGEKWAKEGLTDSLFGTFFSILCLIPFGLFFLRQAKKDARLFEADFYSGFLKKFRLVFKR